MVTSGHRCCHNHSSDHMTVAKASPPFSPVGAQLTLSYHPRYSTTLLCSQVGREHKGMGQGGGTHLLLLLRSVAEPCSIWSPAGASRSGSGSPPLPPLSPKGANGGSSSGQGLGVGNVLLSTEKEERIFPCFRDLKNKFPRCCSHSGIN